MSAGRLRSIITIRALDQSGDDGFGNKTVGSVDRLVDQPAEIKPLKSMELHGQSGNHLKTTYLVRLRWVPELEAVKASDEVVETLSNRTFEIVSAPINPDQRKAYGEFKVITK